MNPLQATYALRVCGVSMAALAPNAILFGFPTSPEPVAASRFPFNI
jgi:hypothetical protein